MTSCNQIDVLMENSAADKEVLMISDGANDCLPGSTLIPESSPLYSFRPICLVNGSAKLLVYVASDDCSSQNPTEHDLAMNDPVAVNSGQFFIFAPKMYCSSVRTDCPSTDQHAVLKQCSSGGSESTRVYPIGICFDVGGEQVQNSCAIINAVLTFRQMRCGQPDQIILEVTGECVVGNTNSMKLISCSGAGGNTDSMDSCDQIDVLMAHSASGKEVLMISQGENDCLPGRTMDPNLSPLISFKPICDVNGSAKLLVYAASDDCSSQNPTQHDLAMDSPVSVNGGQFYFLIFAPKMNCSSVRTDCPSTNQHAVLRQCSSGESESTRVYPIGICFDVGGLQVQSSCAITNGVLTFRQMRCEQPNDVLLEVTGKCVVGNTESMKLISCSDAGGNTDSMDSCDQIDVLMENSASGKEVLMISQRGNDCLPGSTMDPNSSHLISFKPICDVNGSAKLLVYVASDDCSSQNPSSTTWQ